MIFLIDPDKISSGTNIKVCWTKFLPCPKDFQQPLYGIITVDDE